MRRGDRDAVRADLVGRVAVARDPVGADDDRADGFALHRDRGRAVDDQRARHARFAQLEHREARALQQRPRLVDEHVQRLAGAMRGDEAAQRRAVAAGRDRAGVAVREHVAGRRKQLDRRLADAAVDVALLVVDAARFGKLVAARSAARGRPPTPS